MCIKRFRYTPENVKCEYCTAYCGRKIRCRLSQCPWLAERIEAGTVTYAEAVRSIIPKFCLYQDRIEHLFREYDGSFWLNNAHKNNMQWFNHQLGYVPGRNTNAYYAAMYLLTSKHTCLRYCLILFPRLITTTRSRQMQALQLRVVLKNM